MFDRLFEPNDTFVLFGRDHAIILLVIAMFILVLITIGKRLPSKRQDQLIKGVSVFVASSVIVWTLLRFYLGVFDYKEDLPFFLCNLLALGIPVLAYTRHPTLFDGLYYIIIGGSTQALITPSLVENFPHFTYLKFWIVHGGIIAVVLYLVFVLRMRPTFKGVWTAFLMAQVYLIVTITINYCIDANYCFLNEKPPGGSFLDLFPDWPWYLLVTDLVMMPFFALFYLPFWFTDRKAKTT